jgi:uncharacterized protein (TIGR02452 family)
MLMDRGRAAQLGRETVEILRAGHYTARSGRTVDLTGALARCKDGTIEYPPERRVGSPTTAARETRVSVENETVLAVGRRLAQGGTVAALNFASATMPGGGFLSGARAQEESIARSSGLFHALEGRAMYDVHREGPDSMYSDYVIYSPDVPVFRTDDGEVLEEPWLMSILTSPAVNANALRMYSLEQLYAIPQVMTGRTAKVLSVAVEQGVRRFILGAWGCGAFGLDSNMMAGIFREALKGPFSGAFEEIVFAITDWSDDEQFIGPFRRVFQ